MGFIFLGAEFQFKNLLAMKFTGQMLYYYCCVVNVIAMKGLNAKFSPKKSIKGMFFLQEFKGQRQRRAGRAQDGGHLPQTLNPKPLVLNPKP